jgi:acetoin utilization deacetylase AcuC-like enzyme
MGGDVDPAAVKAPARKTRRLDRLRRLAGLGWAGLGLAPRATFVYSPAYQLELPGVAADARRGERILAALAQAGLLKHHRSRQSRQSRQIAEPTPATWQQLRRVHSDEYLESLGRPGALTRVIGLDLPDPYPDRVVEMQRLMTGGTIAAARIALGDRGSRHSGGSHGSRPGVGINLGGGFHHAFAGRGERFCLVNDVAVAVAELRAGGFGEPVLVVDLDLHDGDGTRALFARDPTVHTFSIHNRSGGDLDAVAATTVELGGGVEDGLYLDTLRSHLPGLLAAVRPGLVIYLAGNDPAADDQLGDWRISPAGLLARDREVAAAVLESERRLPLAVVLAGGYGPQAWSYSARFFSWLLSGQAVEPPSNEELTVAAYRRLAERLDPRELSGDGASDGVSGEPDDWGLTADDLAGFGGMRARSRFLGYYSPQGIELALERAGLLDRLRRLGFAHPTLEVDLDNPGGETLRLWGDGRRRDLLIELRVRIDRHTVPEMAMLRIEWLLLQNPLGRFTPQRPRLPGQRFPGLGLLPDIAALTVLVCDRLHLDGILFVPSHFHTARQGRKVLRFLAPEDEGLFRALEAALAVLPLAEATGAVDQGRVLDGRDGGAPLRWHPMPMVLPVSDRLKERLASAEREAAAAAAAARHAFEIRP